MIKARIILVFALLFGQFALSQQIWTLETCLDSAVHNNRGLAQVDLDSDISVLNYNQTIYNFTPTLDGSLGHSYNFGRNLDPVSNQFTQTSRQNSNMSLSANLVLFNGLSRYFSLKRAGLSVENSIFNKKVAVRNLKLQVLTAYLQALLSRDVIRLSQDHLAYTLAEENRMLALIEAENKTKVDLIEIASQKARDELTLIRAQNDFGLAMQQLMQVMQVSNTGSFDIDTNTAEILVDREVFKAAEQMPEVHQRDLLVNQAILDQKISRASYFPMLSLRAGVGSGYSNSYFLLDPITGNQYVPNFGDQFSNNLYQSISFSLYVPIYTKHQTRTNVQVGELEIKKAELEREQLIWELKGTLEKLKTDILNAQAELEAATVLLNYAQDDFNQAELRYQEGQITYTELLNKKDRLYNSQSNVVQSKYNYYFKCKIVTFYNE